MLSWITFKRESKGLLSLALPMMLAQIGQISLSIIDTIMIATVSVVALAGASFGGAWSLFFFIIAMGLCSAVHVYVSHGGGSKNPDHAIQVLKHAIWVVTLYSLPLALIATFGTDLLELFDQKPEVLQQAKPYFIMMMWANIPGLIFRCIKNYLEALGHPWMAFGITLIAIVANIALNWVFIFGHLGAPAWGAMGAGFATLLARSLGLVLIILLVLSKPEFQLLKLFQTFFQLSGRLFSKMLFVGGTSMVQIAFEFGYVTALTTMMGWLGKYELAAQQILLNYSALIFMIPLSIAFATTIRTGRAMGEKNYALAQNISWSATLLGTGIMGLFAVITFFARHHIAPLFVTDPQVVAIAGSLFIFLAMYQVWDGIQVTVMGGLRGIPDMMIPLLIVCATYWGIGIPASYVLGFTLHGGAEGLWLGFVLGVVLAALFLTLRKYLKMKSLTKKSQMA